MADWYIGQKIIRVSDTSTVLHGFERLSIIGHVYTIRDIATHPWSKDQVFFLLEEIINKEALYGGVTCECRFGSNTGSRSDWLGHNGRTRLL
jgi:hypothetical protein